MLRFSLAGVQLKFSALNNDREKGGLTVPIESVGGSWIVKLPSRQYPGVPEDEHSIMTIAKAMGMGVPTRSKACLKVWASSKCKLLP
ncbi:HipA domain-containing protein [Bradyrhizobium sp. NBAIM01]|uniref:HipA domain-containing protein n=1 Tax=Bradyrhizobium sp. NBAIM01 TaxID=2793818 RepID=UPI001CD63FC9|nr:HipA domain-containing protein [Bradyrhizobium sp. NBAIM01]